MFLVKISNVEGGPFQLSNAIEKCFETKQKFIIPNKKKYMLKIKKKKIGLQLRDSKNDFIFNFNLDDKMKNL